MENRNWTMIGLWLVSISLIVAVIMLYVEMEERFKYKASQYEFELYKKSVLALENPVLTFSTDKLQIVNDKIAIQINKVEKYLTGYKIELGVLNTSALTLDDIKLSIITEYGWDTIAEININEKLPSGNMANNSITIKNINEKQLMEDIFRIDYIGSSFHYKQISDK